MDVELSLVHLRIVHTLCEQQRQELFNTLVETGVEPQLRPLLNALQPAVYVLAEVERRALQSRSADPSCQRACCCVTHACAVFAVS